jgi:hypothetical protein
VFGSYIARVAIGTAIILFVCLSPASSRQWKITPELLARDYAAITDTRLGETVMLSWFVPEALQPSATAVRAVMQKYVILTVVHSKMDRATGINSFEDIGALEPKDQSGKSLVPVAREDLPPASVAILAGGEAVFRQSLGAFGKGLKVFVFEKGDVDSCKKGQLSVAVAGETYSWETPFPGCSKTISNQQSAADKT